jgi:uncharacterized protein YjbI with pentapeptide repeats
MRGTRVINTIKQHKTAIVFTIIGLIAGPIVGAMLVDYISITPNRLVKHLENGEVSQFNNERKQLKQHIVFEGIDLSNKDLNGVNLQSLIILHSNLTNTNLENSILDDVQISGDLSDINLRNTSLFNADLTDADLSNADLIYADVSNADLTNTDLRSSNLTNANLNLANLRDSLFDCNSLNTTSFTINANQVHIVDSNLKEVSNCQ